jgi:hypothetical protein
VHLPTPPLAGRGEGRTRSGSHVHLSPIDEAGIQLYPDGPTPTPQTIQCGLPTAAHQRQRTDTSLSMKAHAHRSTGPNPPGFEPAPHNEASTTGSLRIPSRLAHRARTIWQYWHVPTLSGPLATQTPPPPTGPRLPSASPSCCDRTATKVSHLHSEQQAPHGAPSSCDADTPARGCRLRWRRLRRSRGYGRCRRTRRVGRSRLPRTLGCGCSHSRATQPMAAGGRLRSACR